MLADEQPASMAADGGGGGSGYGPLMLLRLLCGAAAVTLSYWTSDVMEDNHENLGARRLAVRPRANVPLVLRRFHCYDGTGMGRRT
jgi:hypothetical protein